MNNEAVGEGLLEFVQAAPTDRRVPKIELLPSREPGRMGQAPSIFDESFQVPISPDDLQQLTDPALTTEQFRELYRRLAEEDQPRYSR